MELGLINGILPTDDFVPECIKLNWILTLRWTLVDIAKGPEETAFYITMGVPGY